MAATISLFDLANLSIGYPEPGVVNFAALHALLHAVLQHLGIQQVQTEHLPDVGPVPAPGPAPGPGPGPDPLPGDDPLATSLPDPGPGPGPEPLAMSVPVPAHYRRLERKVRDVELQVQELSRLPNAVELLQRSRHDGRAMNDVWSLLQLRKSTDLNREGVDKAMSMMEEVMQEMHYLKQFKSTTEDHIKEINRNLDLVTNQMISVNEVLNKSREELEQFVPWKTLQSTLVDPPMERFGVWSVGSSQVTVIGLQPDNVLSSTDAPSKMPAPIMQAVHADNLPLKLLASPKLLSPSPVPSQTVDRYPEAVSALKRIRHATDNQPILDRRVSALEKVVADLAALTMDGDETQDPSEHRAKSAGAADGVKADDVQTQITDLRDMVKNIDEELNELRKLQPGGPVQQQLDKLGSVLEKIMSSSCALLGMSLGLETDSTCPVCSLDVSQDASNLCQRFQRLQETVSALTDPSGEGLKMPDGTVRAQVQSHIQQLQGECEKLNGTTDQLLQEHQQHQRNIQSLFDSLNRLESKCGEGNISRLQFDAVTDQINKMMQGLLNKICSQEKDWNCVLERLTAEMECKLDRIELDPLKKQLEDRWRSVRKLLQNQRGSMDEGAAGLRKQLISHFHCLSCDRPLDIKVPCAPSVITLPLSSYPVSGLRPPRSDIDPTRRRGKGWCSDKPQTRSQMQRRITHMQRLHSSLCRQIERVQNHFKGSVKAVSPFMRPLLHIGCPVASSVPRKAYESIVKSERIAELLDTYPGTARSCGGSHTLTYARRCPRLYDPYPLTPDQDLHKREESAVMSSETSGTKGRSNCRLPSIGGRDGARCKPPRCPSQRPSVNRLCSSRLSGAHFPTVVGSGPATADRGPPLPDRDCLCGVPSPPCPCPNLGGPEAAPAPQSLSCPTPEPLAPLAPPDIGLPPPITPVNI